MGLAAVLQENCVLLPLSAQGTGLGFALLLCCQVTVYFWGGCPTISHHFCTGVVVCFEVMMLALVSHML